MMLKNEKKNHDDVDIPALEQQFCELDAIALCEKSVAIGRFHT